MGNGAFAAGGCTGSIEAWCGAAVFDKCCGICFQLSISGMAQQVWALISTLCISLTILLEPEEAWSIGIVQGLFVGSQNFSVALMMRDPKGISRFQAMINFTIAMSWLPIMTAVWFSPAYIHKGQSKAMIREAEFLKANHELRDEHRQRHYQQTRPSPGPGDPRPRFDFQAMVTDLIREEKKELEKAESHYQRQFKIKASSLGAWWLFVMGFSTVWWGLKVWGGNYEFAELACDGDERFGGALKTSENGMRVYSYIMLVISFIVNILQIAGPWFGMGGAEVWRKVFHKPIKNALKGLTKTNEVAARVRNPRVPGVAQSHEDFMTEIKKLERVQFWAWAFTFFMWAVGNGAIYGVAVRDFMLLGDDPWTFGQLEMFVLLIPHFNSIYRAWRSRSEGKIALAKLTQDAARGPFTDKHEAWSAGYHGFNHKVREETARLAGGVAPPPAPRPSLLGRISGVTAPWKKATMKRPDKGKGKGKGRRDTTTRSSLSSTNAADITHGRVHDDDSNSDGSSRSDLAHRA